MANNRMWLYHRPTGDAICLGKRMGMGYYAAPGLKDMEAFYDRIEDQTGAHQQDDFMLVLEDASEAPCTYQGPWHYEGRKPNLT